MMVGQRIGPFYIEKEIGSGAMGTVYRATFEKDGRTFPVALKVIALGLLGNEGAMARFEREGEILKQLRHKHIVRLIAIGRYKQTPFLAMEYIDGEALDRIIFRRGRLAWEDVIVYAKQLCQALQYAHDKGIIHRDLKPSNLMITRDGMLKLTDFGIAKDVDVTALTGANSTIGTAAYMSPEQCKGDRHLTNKSDLYSLGVVFYELLTGKKPFVAETTVDMFLKHVNEVPVRPSKLVPDLPVWLDNLVMFLLEKDKDKRPLDAGIVEKMLEDIEVKVRTQQSAGADIVNARRIDRGFGKEIDESDRAAARTLRDSIKGRSGRKTRKKKHIPFYERPWLKAIPLVAVLAVIAGLLWYTLKPPSQDDLFNAWKNASNPEAKVVAADRYLRKYGMNNDERTEEVRAGLRQSRGEKLESILTKRFNRSFAGRKLNNPDDNEDPEAFAAAWAAMEAEDKGELGQAVGFWKRAAARANEAEDDYRDGWAWFAEKRIAEINALDTRLAEVRNDVVKALVQEQPWMYDPTQPESVARLAVRYDGDRHLKGLLASPDPTRKPLPHIKDPAKARKTWDALAELARGKPEQNVWRLLGMRERDRYAEIKAEPALAERVQMLQSVLAAVQQEWSRIAGQELLAEERECRNRCRDVIELYADEADTPVKKLVEQAEALLKKMEAKR